MIMMKKDCGEEGEGDDYHEEGELKWTKKMTTKKMLATPTMKKKASLRTSAPIGLHNTAGSLAQLHK